MNVVTKTPIKDFYGKIIGFLEEDNNGNQRAKDFYGRIVGTYDKASNYTKDFYGRKIGRGNMLTALLFKK